MLNVLQNIAKCAAEINLCLVLNIAFLMHGTCEIFFHVYHSISGHKTTQTTTAAKQKLAQD